MAMLTAKQISALAVELLRRKLVLPETVTRAPGSEFSGDNGDTITVRVRTPRVARKQTTPGADITMTGINETSVDVKVYHLYDAATLTDEEIAFSLKDFGSQVLEPQAGAIAIGAEDELCTAINGTTPDAVTVTDWDAAIKEAREALARASVPASDRWLVVAPDVYTELLGIDKFVRADAAGDGRSSAIRDAIVGRIYGFTVVESAGLADGTAVAYHKSGYVFTNRTPVAPWGNEKSAALTVDGIGIRHILQYNPNKLKDQSVLSTFAGAALVSADRVFKMTKAAA